MTNQIDIKKLDDPRFYLENLCKIKGKSGAGLEPFIFKPAQLDIVNVIQRHNRVMIMKARQIGFCLDKDTKILSSDLEWITAEDICVGQEIVSVQEKKQRRGKQREMLKGVVEAKKEVFENAFKITFEDGSTVIATKEHRFMGKKWESSTDTVWKHVSDMEVGDTIRSVTSVSGKLILGKTRPSRFNRTDWWQRKSLPNSGWRKIVSIEAIGKRKMIDIQTSEKTFIANGLVSHNSTVVTGYLYHKTITTSGVTTAIVGYNNDMTAELLDKIKTFYRTTPDSLKPTIQYNSKYEISFPKMDSKIMVLPSTENVARGYTVNYCLSGNTRIIMGDFSEKKIKNIKKDDRIINGKGGFSDVYALTKKKNTKKLIKISSYGADDLVLTEDHRVLTRNFLTKEPIWKEAGKLKKGDYLAYPYSQCKNRVKTIELPLIKSISNNRIKPIRKIKINKRFGLFVGWYLSEGSFDGLRLTLSIHKNEVKKVLDVVNEVRPYVGKISVNYSKTSNSASIRIYGKEFGTLISNMFGNGSNNKIINQSVWNWGWDVSYSILRGLIDGDGYTKEDRKIQIVTVSKKLANSVKRLMVSLRLGLPSIYTSETSRYNKKSQTRYDIFLCGKGNYKLRRKLGYKLPIFNNNRAYWRTNNLPNANQGGGYWKRGKCYYWSKIDSVEESEYEKYVYDISLKDDPHSFLTHAGVVHNCLLTELPFWEKVEGKMTTLEASVPVNGKIVIESSPGAVGDYFHRMWVSENDYIKKEYGWWWNYTEEEVEIIRRRMDNERQFNNNYSLEFLISGRSVFTQETIAKQRKNVLKVGDSVKLENGMEHVVRKEDDGFRMYKPVEDGHQYVVGADCAEGVTGGDYSVCSIIDRGSGEEVGFYRNRIASDRFAKFLNKWGRYYNNALMVVESEAHGNVVLNVLKQLLYPSLYFRPANFDTIGNPWSDKLGWKTTRVTRPILIDEFEQMTREGSLKVHSKETVDEMTVFVFNDANNMVAMESYFDDCIFATAIACQGFKVLSDKPLDQINYARHLPYSGY